MKACALILRTRLASRVAIAIIVSGLTAGSISNAHVPPALSGTVLNTDNAGVAGLDIRVTPIERDMDPVYTTTDNTGAFRFMILQGHIHVLDVINGHNLLHREVVDIQKRPRLVIKVAGAQ
jgi:hypothetical protein